MNAPNLKFLKKNHEQLFKNIVQIAKKYQDSELSNKLSLLFNYYANIDKDETLENISISDLRNEVSQLSIELHNGVNEESIKITGQDLEEKSKNLFKHGNYEWLGNYRKDDMAGLLKRNYQHDLERLDSFNDPDDLPQELNELMLDTFHSCYLLNPQLKRNMDEREKRFIQPLVDVPTIRGSTVMDEMLSKRIGVNLFSRMLQSLDEESELEGKKEELQQEQEKNEQEQQDLKNKQQELEDKQQELEEQEKNAQSQQEKNNIEQQKQKNKQEQQKNKQDQQQANQKGQQLQQQSDQVGQQLDQQKQENNQKMKECIVKASNDAKQGMEIKQMLQLSMPGGLKPGTEAVVNEVRSGLMDKNALRMINMKEFLKIIKSTKFFDVDINDFKNDVFGITSGITIGDNIREVLTDELLMDDWQFYQNYIEANLLQYELKANSVPTDYILLIDNSGSMNNVAKMTVSRAVAYWIMLKTIREKGNAYLWFFNAAPQGPKPISFKEDKKDFLNKLFGTTCNGGTDITSALEATIEFIKNDPVFQGKRDKEVILISDHESNIDREVLERKNFKLNAVLVGARGQALKTIQEFTEKHKVYALDEAGSLLKALAD